MILTGDYFCFWFEKLTKFGYTYNRHMSCTITNPLSRSVTGAMLPDEFTVEDIEHLFPLRYISLRLDATFLKALEIKAVEPFEAIRLNANYWYNVETFFNHFYFTLPEIALILNYAWSTGNLKADDPNFGLCFTYFIFRHGETLANKKNTITGESSEKGGI